MQAMRKHWSIKNAYHWVLDIAFGKDDSCTYPAVQITTTLRSQGHNREGFRQRAPQQAFVAEGAVYDNCPLRLTRDPLKQPSDWSFRAVGCHDACWASSFSGKGREYRAQSETISSPT